MEAAEYAEMFKVCSLNFYFVQFFALIQIIAQFEKFWS